MEERRDALGLLDCITAPSFCVKENQIIKANAAAAALFFTEGMAIHPLIATGLEAYLQYADGCLCLTVGNNGKTWNATVTRQQDTDVFILDQDASGPELKALALAARELRGPLNSAVLMASRLQQQEDPEILDQISRLNRGLYQLMRIVSNMSDAGSAPAPSNQTVHDIARVVDEILQKTQALTEAAGLTMHYSGLQEPVFTLCNPEQLERAIMNIVSNAIKFTPKGGSIDAAFTRSGNMLRLSIQDSGSGIADHVLRSIFYRYLRQGALEDSRYGIGLGMVLVRTAAVQHGGTVLIDQPDGKGTRVTMTMVIRQDETKFSNTIIRPVAGGYDTGLIEFSEVLPLTMYNGTK